jgi:hypothetical protein
VIQVFEFYHNNEKLMCEVWAQIGVLVGVRSLKAKLHFSISDSA